jgi:hypothetical protein
VSDHERGNHDPIALWCVPVADLGGVARHVLDATRAGIPGWRVVVLCPEGPLAEELRAQGTPVVTGPVSPADGTRAAVRTIRRTLHRLRPDLLHTHLAFADLAGVAAVTGLRSGRGRRIRLISTEHGISGVRGYYQAGTTQAQVKAGAHRARLVRTDRVIAVSDSTAEQIAAQWGSGRKVTVIRNGVDLPENPPTPRPGLRVLSLARLSPEKNIDQLLRAFALVAGERPDARLTIAGRGQEEGALRSTSTTSSTSPAMSTRVKRCAPTTWSSSSPPGRTSRTRCWTPSRTDWAWWRPTSAETGRSFRSTAWYRRAMPRRRWPGRSSRRGPRRTADRRPLTPSTPARR